MANRTLPSIEDEWVNYASYIFQGMEVSREQYTETRKAFFAGFTAMMFQFKQINLAPMDDVSRRHLDCLWSECVEFKKTQDPSG
jgi:hypothetical protein